MTTDDPFDPEDDYALRPPDPPPPPAPADHHDHAGVGDRWVYGPPGTGKTTFLAKQIAFDAQHRGSDLVVACSHTKAAAAEIALRHVPLPPDNVGTLHSLAYRALDSPKLIETPEGLKAFGEAHPQYATSATRDVADMEALLPGKSPGDDLLAEYSRYRNLEVDGLAWPTSLQNFAQAWESFKRETDGIDFCDMIELALRDTTGPAANPEVLIVDEGQDLSRLQFRLVTKWARNVEKFVMCLDPDQSLYGWAGADPTVFLETTPSARKDLVQSYRVPRAVHALAMRWICQTRRVDVAYQPRDAEGEVLRLGHTWRQPETLLHNLEQDLAAGKTVMVLATCAYMLDPLVALLRCEGVPFHNPYRRKAGAWNPLRRTRNATATHDRLADFLAPFAPEAERMWTSGQLVNWTALVKGVFKRGGRGELEKLYPQASEGEVVNTLIRVLAEDAYAAAVCNGPPGCLDWLEQHLCKDRQTAGRYAIAVARRLGAPALREEPRLIIGTIHSVKGGEADVVYLFPDLSPQGGQQYAGTTHRDEVVRQFYVGMTRAKETLALLASCEVGVEWEA